MRDYGEWARNSVRVWMREVMAARNWSANEWATMAHTSPTNITRMLSPTSKTVPSIDTISKLAMIAQSQPQLYPGAKSGIVEVLANFCPSCGYDLRAVTQPPRAEPARRPA